MKKVIFDCDPGHDDIFAFSLIASHAEDFDLLGCTTVAGNQTVDKVTDNLCRVMDYLKVDYPIAKGASKSMSGFTFVQPDAHGETGMDGPILPSSNRKIESLDAVSWMRETISQQSEPIIIIATGPLTNIGRLLDVSPEIKNKISQISLMGGSIYSGNITASAEFNIYVDPLAADKVFKSGIPIVMSGLEVCNETIILHDEINLFNRDGAASRLIFELLEFYSQYAKKLKQPGSPLFDLVPVAHLLRPELFESKSYHIEIETEGMITKGKTVADLRAWADPSGNNAQVLISSNRTAVIELFLDSVASLDRS
jgi:pyrimidine-specific ribonucleoside hydrolase